MKKFPEKALITLVLASLGLTLLSWFGIFEPVRAGIRPVRVHDDWQMACPDPNTLQSGDLIFRSGRGFISDAFCQLSLHDHRYSHVGIIHKERGKVYVYHSIGGEGNANNRMKKETLQSFCSVHQIHSFGIYKLNLAAEEKKIVDSLAGNYYMQGLEFDTRFDLSSDSKMYCTELVYKILNQASQGETFIPTTTFAGKKYIACDNIQLSALCSEMYSYIYSY